ncbi:MAG: helix-turn-helix domain-containing protein [Vicinamibacterales bacterium]
MGAHELAFVGLAGSGFGTALGVPMLWPWSRRALDVQLLGAALLLMSAIAALISARLAGLAPASAVVDHAINVLGLNAVPLGVLYARQATAATVTLRWVGWLWAPAAAYLVLVVSRTLLGLDTRVPFAWLLPVALGFTAVGIITLSTRGRGRRPALVPAEWVVAFMVMLNAAQIVRMEFGHVAVVRAVVPLVLSIGFAAMAAFAAWRSAATTMAMLSPEPARVPSVRYGRSGLGESDALDLLDRIDRALTRDRLFARADLTLAQLAVAVGSTPHLVSEALNYYAGESFHDLINRRRVEDVKAQLLDTASERFTIEGIGASAGFGSRSALYTAFRRFEGMTPAAFRASRQPPQREAP